MNEEDEKKQLESAIIHAVRESFPGGMPHFNRREVKQRFDVAYEFARELRFGRGWSLIKVKDLLPRFLKMRLSGIEVDLDFYDGVWSPDGEGGVSL